MNEMIEAMKSMYPEYICLYKIGSFYCAYNRDAYIMAHLFKYKLRDKKDDKEVGFPIDSVNKIKARLEQEKINYVLFDTKKEYEITAKADLGEANRYKDIYVKARNSVNYRMRIDSINNTLLDMIDECNFKKILSDVEEIIYAGDRG